MARRLLLGLLVCGTAACGLFSSAERASRAEMAVAASARRVERADTRAIAAAWDVGSFASELRYNPAPCECPSWEVIVAGRWLRAELQAERGADPEVAEVILSRPDHTVPAEVKLTDALVGSETGWHYLVVEVLSVGPAR